MMNNSGRNATNISKANLTRSMILLSLCLLTNFSSPTFGGGAIMTGVEALSTSCMLPQSAYDTILKGKIAVVPNFLEPSLVTELRKDAIDLYRTGYFSADALAAYGKEAGTKFDPSLDRTVLKLNQWKRNDIGNASLRHETFGTIMSNLRADLATNLNRPHLADPSSASVNKYGIGSTEISFTRFGPGAFLKRHIDEHHEELKGRRGWEKPTRRSVSWLVYLNEEDWDVNKHGGQIRCFERKAPSSGSIGALPNGDLQIGWLRALPGDATAVEQPVFLNGRLKNNDGSGNCAMYTIDNNTVPSTRRYISREFNPDPVLFLSGGDFFARKLLIDNPALAPRFHFLEPPKSAADRFLGKAKAPTQPGTDEFASDVAPIGGTLVMFDSVSLPHEVLPSFGRERWAASGWYHEDQQQPSA